MTSLLRLTKILSLTAIAGLAFSSCKKVSNISIDNDNVVRIPYSLYVANYLGTLYNTNDGLSYKMVFPADGYPMSAIVTSSTNLLFIKDNLHFSRNNGENFYSVYTNVNNRPWQEQIIDVPMQNRMYVSSTEGNGVAFSADNGETWQVDDSFDKLMPPNYDVTSFAELNDGSVYGFSNVSMMLIKKPTVDDRWAPVVIEGVFPADDGEYYLSGNGKSLYLIDYSGVYSNYASEDGGIHWRRIDKGALPFKSIRHTVAQAPGGPLIVGTDHGIFKEEGTSFTSSSGGLEVGTVVYRLTVKKNVYKNDAIKYFVFAATNNGIYRSDDKGYNWKRMTDTMHSDDYRAMY